MSKSKKEEYFEEAIQMYKDGYLQKDIAKKYEISAKTMQRWVRDAEAKAILPRRKDRNYVKDSTRFKILGKSLKPVSEKIPIPVKIVESVISDLDYLHSFRLKGGEVMNNILKQIEDNIENEKDIQKLANALDKLGPYIFKKVSDEEAEEPKNEFFQNILNQMVANKNRQIEDK